MRVGAMGGATREARESASSIADGDSVSVSLLIQKWISVSSINTISTRWMSEWKHYDNNRIPAFADALAECGEAVDRFSSWSSSWFCSSSLLPSPEDALTSPLVSTTAATECSSRRGRLF
jgi:hypothetical protein